MSNTVGRRASQLSPSDGWTSTKEMMSVQTSDHDSLHNRSNNLVIKLDSRRQNRWSRCGRFCLWRLLICQDVRDTSEIPDPSGGHKYPPSTFPVRTSMQVWRRGRSPTMCVSPRTSRTSERSMRAPPETYVRHEGSSRWLASGVLRIYEADWVHPRISQSLQICL